MRFAKNVTVKEQRVNSSWYGINLPYLRCTLTDFERNYQVKIPSNQIIQKQFYCVTSYTDNTITKTSRKFEPCFITGFTDAEGCFLIIVRKSPKSKLGWKIETNFTINFHSRDLSLLKLIQVYFGGVGRIGKERNGCCDFTINSLNQILTKVIPHFDKYSLKTSKYSDYSLFKKVVMIMQQ